MPNTLTIGCEIWDNHGFTEIPMTQLSFTKMHGAGNDFVVLDGVRASLSLTPDQLRFLADRRFGIGADQILLVEPAQAPATDIDFHYRIFNASGDEVEHCGNGARCLYRFIHDQGLSTKPVLRVKTINRVLTLSQEGGEVNVEMGVPNLDPASLPMVVEELPTKRVVDAALFEIPISSTPWWVCPVSMGNPHVVYVSEHMDADALMAYGRALQQHSIFPEGVNVGMMQVINAQKIRLRVWERGVGETLACGTGACAAVVAGILAGQLTSPVKVHARGGVLTVVWAGQGEPVFLRGPTATVFTSTIDVDNLQKEEV